MNQTKSKYFYEKIMGTDSQPRFKTLHECDNSADNHDENTGDADNGINQLSLKCHQSVQLYIQ